MNFSKILEILGVTRPESFNDLVVALNSLAATDNNDFFSVRASVTGTAKDCVLTNSKSNGTRLLPRALSNPIARLRLGQGKSSRASEGMELTLSIPRNQDIEDFKNLAYSLELILERIVTRRSASLRNKVIDIGQRSHDPATYSHRVVTELLVSYFKVEAASMYMLDPRNSFLKLVGTTGMTSELEKKDINYSPLDDGNLLKCFNLQEVILLQSEEQDDPDTFREKIISKKIFAVCYLPIGRTPQYRNSSDKIVGVLKLINPHSTTLNGPSSKFHCLDIEEATYIAELVSVMMQNYVRALDAETDLERTVHGFETSIFSGLKHVSLLQTLLFGDAEQKIERSFVLTAPLHKNSTVTELDAEHLLENLKAFLEDMAFQIQKALSVAYKEREIISRFHTEVLAPVLKMTKQLERAYSSRVIKINKLTDAGSTATPPIIGSVPGYISVFRNLLENSVKYCIEREGPHIEITFTDQPDFYEIHIRDTGIGIAAEDERYLFTEGFRSSLAKRRSNRGTGIGLAYARETMRSFGGDLCFLSSVSGAHFVMKLKKAPG